MARLKPRRAAGCQVRGFVLTSIAEQLDDHLGGQQILPVGDKEPSGRLVHTTLDEPCPQLVVRELGPPGAHR
jgi:hypothetical protein